MFRIHKAIADKGVLTSPYSCTALHSTARLFVALLRQLYCYKSLLSSLSVNCGLVKEPKPTRLIQVGMYLTSL